VGIEPVLLEGPARVPEARYAWEENDDELEPAWEVIDDGEEREYERMSKLGALELWDCLGPLEEMDGLVENAGPARGEERSGLEARTEERCTPCPPRSRNAVGGATATPFNEEGECCQCQCQTIDGLALTCTAAWDMAS